MTEQVRELSGRFAVAINRRRFLRRAANVTFGAVAAASAGQFLSPTEAFGYASACESPAGLGCPRGCGNGQCCNYSGRTAACQCGTGTSCKNDGRHCLGRAATWGGTACWTCTYKKCTSQGLVRVQTTCCDCKTSGCEKSGHICISYKTTKTLIGGCRLAPDARPVGVIEVDSGDPATSWMERG